VKPLALAAAAGIAGVVVLAVLFPRLDPAARFPTTLSRADAVTVAAGWSAKYGVDPHGWPATVTLVADPKVARYRSVFPGDPAGSLFSPVAWGVRFKAPGGATVRVKLTAGGGLAEWESSTPGVPAVSLADLAGDSTGSFTADGPDGPWEWRRDQLPLVARVETGRREGRLVSVVLKPVYEHWSDDGARQVALFFFGVFVVIGSVVATVAFFRAWRRGAFTWRLPAAMVLMTLLWAAAITFGGAARQDRIYGRGSDPALAYFGAVAAPLVLLILGGAGYGLARNRYRGKWASIERAVRGQMARRAVGRPLAAGILCGVAIAAIPYPIAKLTGAPLTLESANAPGMPFPAIALVSIPMLAVGLGFFGFALPFAMRFRARWGRLACVASVLAALAIVCGTRFESLGPATIQGIAMAAICVWLFVEFDVLAPVAALATAHAVLIPCILLVQPVAAFRDSGERLLFLLATVTIAAVYVAVRGEEYDAVEESALATLDFGADAPRSARERLQAEFEVARKAQQDALPAVPPPVNGFTFDAVCEPAQQVGGDLYDFFPLSDGRLGVVVADVSGKGVPAALYMMVTKGLLGAASQDSGDLRHILQSVNLHLHKACKRKVFVTLAAIALDPASRRVEYGRAGHNPIVWRRTRRGETLLLKPGGVGLGMCSAEPFARSLRMEEFDLEPGDALVLYSDGVTEAVNPAMDQYGEDRLMRAVEAADGASAEGIRAAVMQDLAIFANGAPARDDITLVAIRAPNEPRQ
jgi:hypothetical protein